MPEFWVKNFQPFFVAKCLVINTTFCSICAVLFPFGNKIEKAQCKRLFADGLFSIPLPWNSEICQRAVFAHGIFAIPT